MLSQQYQKGSQKQGVKMCLLQLSKYEDSITNPTRKFVSKAESQQH